jgi:hypothetical protein
MNQILNLGYAYPWGYTSSSQGVGKILNLIIISPQKLNKRGFGGRPKESILVWGYAKGFNIDLGGTQVENP